MLAIVKRKTHSIKQIHRTSGLFCEHKLRKFGLYSLQCLEKCDVSLKLNMSKREKDRVRAKRSFSQADKFTLLPTLTVLISVIVSKSILHMQQVNVS